MKRLALLALAFVTLQAAARGYPSKPVRMVNPFPPGGPLDVLGRILSDRLGASLGRVANPFVSSSVERLVKIVPGDARVPEGSDVEGRLEPNRKPELSQQGLDPVPKPRLCHTELLSQRALCHQAKGDRLTMGEPVG